MLKRLVLSLAAVLFFLGVGTASADVETFHKIDNGASKADVLEAYGDPMNEYIDRFGRETLIYKLADQTLWVILENDSVVNHFSDTP